MWCRGATMDSPSGIPPCHFVTFPLSGGTFSLSPLTGEMSAAPTEGFIQNEVPPHTPLSLRDIPPFRGNSFFVSPNRGDVGCADRGVHAERSAAAHHLSLRDIPRVVEKSVNSVSAFGAKSSVHSLSPPLPIEPANAGLRQGPQLGELLAYTRKSLPCKGRCRWRRQRGSCRTKCRRTPPCHFVTFPLSGGTFGTHLQKSPQ